MSEEHSPAWSIHADALARWAWDRYPIRFDVWGGYNAIDRREKQMTGGDGKPYTLGKVRTCPVKKNRGIESLTFDTFVRHFRATTAERVIGIHTTSAENLCKFGVIEIDAHGEEGNDPEATLRASLAWYDRLVTKGFRPLLWDSDGKGGFHLDLLFSNPVPSADLRAWLLDFVSDHAQYGLPTRPEIFPKQFRINRDGRCKYGNWARLPGRHHTRAVWATVWNGAEWLAGEDAVAFILSIEGGPSSLIPTGGELISRGRAYAAKVPTLGEGQGRDDNAYRLMAFLARNLNMSEANALLVANEWDMGNRPPKGHERLAELYRNALEYGTDAIGSGIDSKAPPRASFTSNQGRGYPSPDAPAEEPELDKPDCLSNFIVVEETIEGKEGEEGEEEIVLVRKGMNARGIATQLWRQSNEWPRRVGSAMFVPDGDKGPLWLPTANDLFGWIQSQYPAKNGVELNSVRWVDRGEGMLSQSQFTAYLKQQSIGYDAVESAPHEPRIANHFYIHPPIKGGDGRALAGLLARYAPFDEEDAILLRAMLMTFAWGGPCGHRPAFLITGEDADSEMGRGIGKTTVIRQGASLFGGTFDVRPNDDWSTVLKRLLSNTECSTQRVMLIDNVKTHRLSWADIEAFITSSRVNGHKLYVGDAWRPNTFTCCITLNGASLSKDLAQRCVIIKLSRPDYSGNWENDTAKYIETHRWAIVGDLIAELKKPVAVLPCFSRWGLWEQEVLGRLPEPERVQDLIASRRAAVDDDQEEATLIREGIIALMEKRGHGEPDEIGVKIPIPEMTLMVRTTLNEPLSSTGVTGKLKAIGGGIPELTKSKTGDQRYWAWRGKNFRGAMVDLKEEYQYAGGR